MVDAEIREPAVADAEQVATRRARIAVRPFLRAHAALIGLGLLALVMIVAQSLWVSMDKQPPSWDPAHYLDLTLGHERALQSRGLPGFFSDVITSDPVRAPLLTMLAAPIFLVAGPGPDRGLILNLLLWPVLLAAVYLLGRRLFTARTGLLAAFLTATTPIVFGLAHDFYVEFLLTTLVALTVLLLLKTDGFTRRGMSMALGVVIGLGMLTKIIFPLYVAGPCLVLGVAALVSVMRARRHGKSVVGSLARVAVNICASGVLAVAVPFFWYRPNLAPSLVYAKWASNGAGGEVYGPANPLSPFEIGKFLVNATSIDLSWLYVLVPLIALTSLFVAKVRASQGNIVWPAAALKIAVLGSWFVIPTLYVTLSRDQDVRFLAPAIPGFALLSAAAIARVPQRAVRRPLVMGTVVLGALQWFAILFTVPLLPNQIAIKGLPKGYYANIWWQGTPDRAYNHALSADWHVDDILTYFATQNATPQGIKPLKIGLLEAHPIFNPNTLGFFADARNMPFTFVDVTLDPAHPDLPSPELRTCDYVLLLQKGEINSTNATGQIQRYFNQLNRSYAVSLETSNVTQHFIQTSANFVNPDGQALIFARDQSAAANLNISHPTSIVFDASIEFLGYDLALYGKTTEGQVYTVTYYWRALRPLPADYQVFVHVGSDPIVAGADHTPPASVGSTSQWTPGQVVRYTHQMFVSNVVTPGSYPMRLGLFIPNVVLVPITAAPEGAAAPTAMGALVGSLVIP